MAGDELYRRQRKVNGYYDNLISGSYHSIRPDAKLPFGSRVCPVLHLGIESLRYFGTCPSRDLAPSNCSSKSRPVIFCLVRWVWTGLGELSKGWLTKSHPCVLPKVFIQTSCTVIHNALERTFGVEYMKVTYGTVVASYACTGEQYRVEHSVLASKPS